MIEKLRQLKKESHMTNQQIAEKSNIPESTVARIFSGKTPNPTVTTVVSMAKAMGCSAADLLNDKDDPASPATSPEHTEIRVCSSAECRTAAGRAQPPKARRLWPIRSLTDLLPLYGILCFRRIPHLTKVSMKI